MSEIYTFEAPADDKRFESSGKQVNNVIALPFIDKDTVVKTMVMLRTLPDQKFLTPSIDGNLNLLKQCRNRTFFIDTFDCFTY